MNLPFQTFLDGAMLGQFWEFVKFILFYVAPIVMIYVALELVAWVIRAIRGTMTEADLDHDRRRRHDDDDDYY